MYFCPNCSYTFDITKSSNKKTEDRKEITIDEIFTKLNENDDLSTYKAEFQKKDLLKNKKYQKLSTNNKLLVGQLFEKNTSSGAELNCTNCNNTLPIKESILLYSIVMSDNNIRIKSIEENKFIAQDPLLPHTKDYICKNPSCITHKNKDLKDSVFYRDKNTFKLNYICGICYFGW